MITWMQRHKKYLIITIWISTIAFVGAGFVGWGQYSYGDKAGAVAKVGEIEITMGELQKSYSRLYGQYNKMFQGNFDEEKAKSFGLQQQALKQLTDAALILNLAASYDLSISDKELLSEITSQEFFQKDGIFNKEIYKKTLSRNNLSLKEYEEDVKKQLLIQKTLKLLPTQTSKSENAILNTIVSIADKINYKVLDESKISVDTDDTKLKAYWETKKQRFMNEASYELNFIKHDANTSKKIALKTYINFKKGKLSSEVKINSISISQNNNPFNKEALLKISKLTPVAPFMKPILINNIYHTFELVKMNVASPKSYEEAKAEVLPLYISEQKRVKLQELATASIESFKGNTTDFITSKDALSIKDLSVIDANEFLSALFLEQTKKGFITLKSEKIVLYTILEQKMLDKTQESDMISKMKNSMFNVGLINSLKNRFKTEIFLQGN